MENMIAAGPLAYPTTTAEWLDGVTAKAVTAFVEIVGTDLVIMPQGAERVVWPLADIRRVKGMAVWEDLTLRRAGDNAARLLVRHPATRKLIEGAAKRLNRNEPVRHKSRLLMFGAGAIASVALIMFVLVPFMAGQLANLMSPRAEYALGNTTLDQVRAVFGNERYGPLQFCEGEDGKAALQKMFDRLAAGADLPHPVELHVLETDMINAFALPGGHVVVMEGLLNAAETPEEVAAVLAHELGHVVARDPTREALRSAGSIGVLGLLFGDFAGGSMVLVLMNQLINADYSQEAEARADAFALKQMTDNDLPPQALATFFRRLQDEVGGSGGIMAHFAAHPELGDRIAAAEAADKPENPRPVLDDKEWQALKWVCGF